MSEAFRNDPRSRIEWLSCDGPALQMEINVSANLHQFDDVEVDVESQLGFPPGSLRIYKSREALGSKKVALAPDLQELGPLITLRKLCESLNVNEATYSQVKESVGRLVGRKELHEKLQAEEGHIQLLQAVKRLIARDSTTRLPEDVFAEAMKSLSAHRETVGNHLMQASHQREMDQLLEKLNAAEKEVKKEQQATQKMKMQNQELRHLLVASASSTQGESLTHLPAGNVCDNSSADHGTEEVPSETASEMARSLELSPSKEDAKRLILRLGREKQIPAQSKGLGETLHRAIQLLARDIYSSDVHFISEVRTRTDSRSLHALASHFDYPLAERARLCSPLIHHKHFFLSPQLLQNADDCRFGSLASPHLPCFVIVFDEAQQNFWAHTNEDGFQPMEVCALCNIGNSTKKGHIGFCGQKGVGFKSTFSVSETPSIFSGSFAFRFNSRSFIAPAWIDDAEHHTQAWPDELKIIAGEDAGTCTGTVIWLPLHRPLDFAQLRQEMRPEVLLFLKNIQRIQVHSTGIPPSPITIASLVDGTWTPGRKVGSGMFKISYPGDGDVVQESFFFMQSASFDVPAELQAIEERRRHVNTSTIQLAFRVCPDGHDYSLFEPDKEEWLFSFLPVDCRLFLEASVWHCSTEACASLCLRMALVSMRKRRTCVRWASRSSVWAT